MDTQDPDGILQKWLDGQISDQELQKKLSKEEALKYIQIIGEVDDWTTDNPPLKVPQLPAEKDAKVVSIKPSTWLSIAASLALLIVAGWWFLRGDVVYYASKTGEVKEVTLPDGKSKVILASGSSISWDEEDWQAGRRFSLIEGTVFFEVEKGSRFIVQADQNSVEVLGTSFEMRERAGRLAVNCYSGKVLVKGRDGTSQTIKKGEYVRWTGDQFEKVDTLGIGDIPSWLDGRTSFKDAPLVEVIDQLELQFGISCNSDDIDTNRRFSGSFGHDSVEDALASVFVPMSITYSVSATNVRLSE